MPGYDTSINQYNPRSRLFPFPPHGRTVERRTGNRPMPTPGRPLFGLRVRHTVIASRSPRMRGLRDTQRALRGDRRILVHSTNQDRLGERQSTSTVNRGPRVPLPPSSRYSNIDRRMSCKFLFFFSR